MKTAHNINITYEYDVKIQDLAIQQINTLICVIFQKEEPKLKDMVHKGSNFNIRPHHPINELDPDIKSAANYVNGEGNPPQIQSGVRR